jgi:probable HAF family extracellular repeat protein
MQEKAAPSREGSTIPSSDVAGSFFHAFVWNGVTIPDLGTLGGASSQAFSINQARGISGTVSISLTSGETYAVLWKDGRSIDIGVQLGLDITSLAHQVNDKGQLVGTAFGFRDRFDYHPSSGRREHCR